MMQMLDMLPMVAMMVGSESVAVGWAVHWPSRSCWVSASG
jgi:hypothetical protein